MERDRAADRESRKPLGEVATDARQAVIAVDPEQADRLVEGVDDVVGERPARVDPGAGAGATHVLEEGVAGSLEVRVDRDDAIRRPGVLEAAGEKRRRSTHVTADLDDVAEPGHAPCQQVEAESLPLGQEALDGLGLVERKVEPSRLRKEREVGGEEEVGLGAKDAQGVVSGNGYDQPALGSQSSDTTAAAARLLATT